jgi:hypothetical protein
MGQRPTQLLFVVLARLGVTARMTPFLHDAYSSLPLLIRRHSLSPQSLPFCLFFLSLPFAHTDLRHHQSLLNHRFTLSAGIHFDRLSIIIIITPATNFCILGTFVLIRDVLRLIDAYYL